MRKIHFISFALLAVLILAMPVASTAQVAFSITIGPPALPVYDQPLCPGPGFIWTPGYWAWGPAGYFWVPGTWVEAPEVGFLWTPGYWGWGGGVYIWHGGYWGPHVGFYGGINYGYGYGGTGYYGGEWRHGVFAYNTAYSHVNTAYVHNTYIDRTVIRNTNVSRVSYNGGSGGIMARPTAGEMMAERDHHVGATSMQTQQEHSASSNRAFLASENHGRPAIAATSRAGDFNRGAVGSRGANNSFHPPTNAGAATHGGTNNATTHAGNPNSNYSHNNTNATRGGEPNYNYSHNDANTSHGGNPNFNPPHGNPNASHAGANGGARPNNTHANEPHNQPHPSNPPKDDEKHH
jgi:hypothetical protein